MSSRLDEANNAEHIQQRVDAIDLELQQLLDERALGAMRIAELCRIAGDTFSHQPERDAQKLREIAKRNNGPMENASITHIFREILSAGAVLQQPIVVAYLGPEGTYSHAATTRHFGHAVHTLPEPGISDIFAAVENGRARFGVVPVENSTEGAINHTLDLLMDTTLRICGEVRLRIVHSLLSSELSMQEISAVHAHPQSLAQCRGWLDTHLPGIPRISESSNAAAAQLAMKMPGIAAIAGESAAERYALNTLSAGIEDIKTNTTRFLIMADCDLAPSGHDSTSLLISAPHKPGGLRRVLLPFEAAGVSLTRIESRPARQALWDYVFFIDVAGHQHDETLAPVLAQLHDEVPLLRVLGSYPSAL